MSCPTVTLGMACQEAPASPTSPGSSQGKKKEEGRSIGTISLHPSIFTDEDHWAQRRKVIGSRSHSRIFCPQAPALCLLCTWEVRTNSPEQAKAFTFRSCLSTVSFRTIQWDGLFLVESTCGPIECLVICVSITTAGTPSQQFGSQALSSAPLESQGEQ